MNKFKNLVSIKKQEIDKIQSPKTIIESPKIIEESKANEESNHDKKEQ